MHTHRDPPALPDTLATGEEGTDTQSAVQRSGREETAHLHSSQGRGKMRGIHGEITNTRSHNICIPNSCFNKKFSFKYTTTLL